MYLHEYQSKAVFRAFRHPDAAGAHRRLPPQMRASIAAEFGVPVVVNAQALDQPAHFSPGANAGRSRARRPRHSRHDHRGRARAHHPDRASRRRCRRNTSSASTADRGSDLLMLASTAGGSEFSQIEQDQPKPSSARRSTRFSACSNFRRATSPTASTCRANTGTPSRRSRRISTAAASPVTPCAPRSTRWR